MTRQVYYQVTIENVEVDAENKHLIKMLTVSSLTLVENKKTPRNNRKTRDILTPTGRKFSPSCLTDTVAFQHYVVRSTENLLPSDIYEHALIT